MGLENIFLSLCQQNAERYNAVYTEVTQDKRMIGFSLYFRLCRVELVYSRKWETLAPPSVLFARFYLNKNLQVYLQLPELLGFLGAKDYRACYFPYIETPERMADCMEALMAVVGDYIPVCEKLGNTGEDQRILDRWARDDFTGNAEKDHQEEIDWEAMSYFCRFQESVQVSRYTTLNAYRAFLDGKWEKAIKKYEKLRKNGLSPYEVGLVEFLRTQKNRNFQPMPAKCDSAKLYRRGEMGDKTDLIGLGLCFVLLAAFLCGLIALINLFFSRGTLYYFSIDWWFGIFLAAPTSLFGYFAFQRFLRPKLGGSVAFLDVQKNPKLNQYLSGAFFAVLLIGCLALCIFLPPMSSRYYADHAVLYVEAGNGTFTYDQVREIYYIQGRYNDFGELVERASCVLVLEDGRQFDLDCDGSPQEQLDMVRHLIPEIPIQELPSDRELPWPHITNW